jgi:anaerobic ribonucleoside-triphosphate reductase activating protein
MSPELKSPGSGRPVAVAVAVAVTRLVGRLLEMDTHLAGVTISGGVPLKQPAALAKLLSGLACVRPEWSVILYTGYLTSEVEKDPARARVLRRVDVLIAGPFDAAESQRHPLAGSGNQQVIALTERGQKMLEELPSAAFPMVDLGLGPRGTAMLIGVAQDTTRRDIVNALAEKVGAYPSASDAGA